MSTTATHKPEHLSSSKHRGKKLRVLKETTGYRVKYERGASTHYNVKLPVGTIVTYFKHCEGPGSDPAYETIVLLEDGTKVHIIVGWFDLRTDTFEVLESQHG